MISLPDYYCDKNKLKMVNLTHHKLAILLVTYLLFSAILTTSAANSSNVIDIKIGFLTKFAPSDRLRNPQTFPRPGTELLDIFNHAITKLNQIYSSSSVQLRFVPIIAATQGNESQSIKQTIELIVRQDVAAIIGPHETCRVESRLASIYNVAMVSHYCSQLAPEIIASPLNEVGGDAVAIQQQLQRQQIVVLPQQRTFVQVKPPNWKIVSKVVSVVGHLLSAYGRYPNQLVLLYYKAPIVTSGRQQFLSIPFGKERQQASSFGTQSFRQVNDAFQYKLIGELLELQLRELLATVNMNNNNSSNNDTIGVGNTGDKHKQLSVLNWHTTYHYGFTRNPFRRLLHRHLMAAQQKPQTQQQQQQPPVNQAQCSAHPAVATATVADTRNSSNGSQRTVTQFPPRNSGAAIYIVVGHYYEHLGLMLALDELNLLEDSSVATETLDDGNNQHHHQEYHANRWPSSTTVNHGKRAIVVGVDIEPYDEQVDSAHFLRGLLSGSRQSLEGETEESSLNSLAAKYTNYLGIVPSKPTRMSDLQEYMRTVYNRTGGSSLGFDVRSGGGQRQPPITTNKTTLDSLQVSTDLFQFLRLPIEAFYLYDSVLLLGAYFNECLQLQQQENAQLSLCSDGQRVFNWFVNRSYFSFVNHNNMSKFDSQAQTDGFYSLISSRVTTKLPPSSTGSPSFLTSSTLQPPIQAGSDTNGNEDDLGLVPIGQFVAAESEIKLSIDFQDISQIWLPFWCKALGDSNYSACETIKRQYEIDSMVTRKLVELRSKQDVAMLTSSLTIVILLFLTLSLVAVMRYLYYQQKDSRGRKSALLIFGKRKNKNEQPHSDINKQSTGGGGGWFSEQDERNFEHIVLNLLRIWDSHLAKSMSNSSDPLGGQQSDSYHLMNASKSKRKTLVELHCHMFPFPSCKFVHWLVALHQMKEMMFQFQANLEARASCNSGTKLGGHSGRAFKSVLPFRMASNSNNNNNNLIDWLNCLSYGDGEPAICSDAIPTVRGVSTTSTSTQQLTRRPRGKRSFFLTKHKGSGTLKLLLHKYKSINECLCSLHELNHPTIVSLFGVTLASKLDLFQLVADTSGGISAGGKVACLILELPERGNLRLVVRTLKETFNGAPNINTTGAFASNKDIGGGGEEDDDDGDDGDDDYESCDANDDAIERFKSSLLFTWLDDLLNGLGYLHESSKLGFHGELRITNCLITSNWRLKLSGFHEHHMRRSLGAYEQQRSTMTIASSAKTNVAPNLPEPPLGESTIGSNLQTEVQTSPSLPPPPPSTYLDELVYAAPEVLANHNRQASLSQSCLKLADIYSFAFLLYELIADQEPWSCLTQVSSSKLLIERAKVDSSFRPPLSRLDTTPPVAAATAASTTAATAMTAATTTTRPRAPVYESCSKLSSSTCFFSHLARDSPKVKEVRSTTKAGTASAAASDLDNLQRVIRSCWSHSPDRRPQSISRLRMRLASCSWWQSDEIGHKDCELGGDRPLPARRVERKSAVDIMQSYASILEIISSHRKRELALERHKNFQLANCSLPDLVTSKLILQSNQISHQVESQFFECVSFCSFRFILLPPPSPIPSNDRQQVNEFKILLQILIRVDQLLSMYRKQLHLVDSQADSMLRFLVCSGDPILPIGRGNQQTRRSHVGLVASFALQLVDMVNRAQGEFNNCLQVKCALHCGPACGGLISGLDTAAGSCLRLPRYVLLGNSLQLVDILEQTSLPQRIQVSAEYRNQLLQMSGNNQAIPLGGAERDYIMIKREAKIQAKYIGELEAFWLVNGPRLSASQSLMLLSPSEILNSMSCRVGPS